MLGLKESGFVISLGVTLLLMGLVAYYVRQRTSELDAKFDQIFKLVQMLNTQSSKHQYTLGRMLGEIPNEPQSTQEQPDNTFTSENEEHNIKGFMDNPELISVSDDDNNIDSDSNNDNDSNNDSDSDDESDSESDNRPILTNEDPTENVKVIDLNNDMPLDEFVITADYTHEETPTDSTKSDNTYDNEDNLESSLNIGNLDKNADYGKMNVKILKEIAQQKGIDIKGKKKTDLVEILSH
jgi:hypothetical protein